MFPQYFCIYYKILLTNQFNCLSLGGRGNDGAPGDSGFSGSPGFPGAKGAPGEGGLPGITGEKDH